MKYAPLATIGREVALDRMTQGALPRADGGDARTLLLALRDLSLRKISAQSSLPARCQFFPRRKGAVLDHRVMTFNPFLSHVGTGAGLRLCFGEPETKRSDKKKSDNQE